jgi:Holliday junction resolvase-like predicted endonuclease
VKSSYSIDDFQDYISKSKIKALQKTAQTWLVQHEVNLPYEFDLALVKDENIDYIENFLF